MNNTSLQLVTFEQADQLDKLGFDWPTSKLYFLCQEELRITECGVPRNHNDPFCWVHKKRMGCSAPTVALALKWIRDVHNLSGEVYASASGWLWSINKGCNTEGLGGMAIKDVGFEGPNDGGAFDTYEAAELALLSELLHLIKTPNC